MSRFIGAAVGVLMLTLAVAAQSNEDKYNTKLEKAFVTNAAWTMDLDSALKKAAEDGKLVFGYFTRSYAP